MTSTIFCRSALADGAWRWHDIKCDVNGGEAHQPSLLSLHSQGTLMKQQHLRSMGA